ncbi:ExbD/TolR family protein [Coraliomargarita akajimensis]|uniref:Biopolymer transport protein ExbD/TolR n=1 Tax=Coraliomargarita akajimensis (strain DSM 45221 / IAM 15411 / JCM 23193 / KCTC 12865 / 04OKA010-24) TaxID=583355 RepID=D5EN76_CORAD|nr:biopolymer transporter ExbD [Coraliomargarita akajimensis]ADE53511.1 Biopolymer transport protein ExbD/TolR [Coraliomargarita akajimensis DSM 45221]
MKWQLEQTDDEPDLTPMIDIVFLLIVFFMTVASVVTQKRVEIEAPVATNSQVAESQEGRETASLLNDGTIYYGNTAVTLEELQAIIADSVSKNPNVQVLLRIDSETEYFHTRDLMAACSEVGAVNIIFTSYQTDT